MHSPYHGLVSPMAAVTPIRVQAEKPRNSPLINVVKVALLAILVGGSVYLLWAHAEWFKDPRSVKAEVVSWRACGVRRGAIPRVFGRGTRRGAALSARARASRAQRFLLDPLSANCARH